MKRNGLSTGNERVSNHPHMRSIASSLSQMAARAVRCLPGGKRLASMTALILALIAISCSSALPVRASGRPDTPIMPSVIRLGDLPKLDGDPVSIDHRADMEPEATFPTGRLTVVLETAEGATYVGTESAGLYRSDDGGGTWVQLTDNMGLPMPNLTVTALAQGHSVDEIYAAVGYWLGTSEAHFAPLGIYATRDGGTTWHAMEGEPPATPIVPMTVDASDPNAVLAMTANAETSILYVL